MGPGHSGRRRDPADARRCVSLPELNPEKWQKSEMNSPYSIRFTSILYQFREMVKLNGNVVECSGGKRSLRLPPELAYGARGAGCRGWEPTSCVIPPNSTLLFDVEYVGRAVGWSLPADLVSCVDWCMQNVQSIYRYRVESFRLRTFAERFKQHDRGLRVWNRL